MTALAGHRKTISVHDYPEHLNPFREEDNHNKIRFWTIGRRLSRSNSINFSGIKDIRNSWSLRSFMRKGKKGEVTSSKNTNSTNHVNGDASPVVYRRAIQYSSGTPGTRSTISSPENGPDRYIYGGSVTPLPRSRFQERLRSSHQDVNSLSATPRMARSDITGSRLSVESTNPFDEEAPVPPVRASRRKKKRAPPPPPTTLLNETASTENLELRIVEPDEQKSHNTTAEDEMEDISFNIELKIVEDKDDKTTDVIKDTKMDNEVSSSEKDGDDIKHDTEIKTVEVRTQEIPAQESAISDMEENILATKTGNDCHPTDLDNQAEVIDKAASAEDILDEVSFPKVNIRKYRRNSSVNEDDIKLRRGNLEDFQPLGNKRSQSLTNNLDGNYITYDINLNESIDIDINSNEPHKVICKVYEETRKKSVDNSMSSTEREFLEIDRATRELEREINKLNTALIEDDLSLNTRPTVSDIRRKFDIKDANSPNPIPKPRRSHYVESNGNI